MRTHWRAIEIGPAWSAPLPHLSPMTRSCHRSCAENAKTRDGLARLGYVNSTDKMATE
jgi:hypothetical protein